MSYVSSGGKSSTPSILKKLGKRSLPVQSANRSVRFDLNRYNNVKAVLENFLNDKNNDDVYKNFVIGIRDNGIDISDKEILLILKDARECLPILDENLKHFVQALLVQKWEYRSETVVTQYQNFILDVCSAYNFYIKFAFFELVNSFLQGKKESFLDDVFQLSVEDSRASQNVHNVIRSLLKMVPISIDVLFEVIKKRFPFNKDSYCYLYYIHNLLTIIGYAPTLRGDILSLIINKLIHLDVLVSKDVIENAETEESLLFPMEVDEQDVGDESDNMKHPEANTLDLCLLKIYKFLYTECHNTENGRMKIEKAKSIYQDLIQIFENILLPTHASNHVQFIYFYFISFKNTFSENFLKYLWNKATNPNIAAIIRQASICYMSGIIARANFVSTSVLQNYISSMIQWIHKYIGSDENTKFDNPHVTRIHGVFYSVCHALFYLIAFRHQELFSDKRDIKFMENLNLGKIVMCRFSPLNVCSPMVANTFAAVMQRYQLTYCFSILKTPSSPSAPAYVDNSKWVHPWRDDFFPFDCYALKRSNAIISPIYREYDGLLVEEQCIGGRKRDEDDNEDDFIHLDLSPHLPQIPLLQASPIMSPGFK